MGSQDNRMCTDYYREWYEDDDYLGDLISNIMDIPVESLDEECLTEDWESKLGPIPSEVFPAMLPLGGGGGGGSLTECGGSSAGTCEAKFKPPTHSRGKNPKSSFLASSPDSVLSSSSREPNSFGPKISIPKRTRSKLSRSGLIKNPWLKQLPFLKMKEKRRRTLTQGEVKKCSHCEITKTPQWREGPMGPKTLCNACGVRYRSGRLFPEYRPAASPTFIPALHSNSHRKVVELRMKGAAAIDDGYL